MAGQPAPLSTVRSDSSRLRSGISQQAAGSSGGLTVKLDLRQVLCGSNSERRALTVQAITVPAEMREIRAFEQHLRLQSWGKFLVEDELTFIIEDDCEVKDGTLSFRRAERVKVVPALTQYDAADFLCAPCTAPSSAAAHGGTKAQQRRWWTRSRRSTACRTGTACLRTGRRCRCRCSYRRRYRCRCRCRTCEATESCRAAGWTSCAAEQSGLPESSLEALQADSTEMNGR